MLVNNTGGSFLWPLNAIYIHDHLGKSLVIAGLALTLNSAAGMIGPLLGGILVEAYGFSLMVGVMVICLFIAIIPSLCYELPLKKQGVVK